MTIRPIVACLAAFLLLAPALPAHSQEQRPTVSMSPDERVLIYYSDPFATKVQIGGDFNGWDPSKTNMFRTADGGWGTAIQVREGRYGWKFVVDGQWENGDNRRLVVIRGKTGRLEVLPDQPTFNTPYNSRIYFSGRFYGQAVFRNVPTGEGVDTGRSRFAPLEFNLQPRMAFTAGEKVTGYMEVDINAQEGRAQTNFSEGEALLTEDWGRFMLFRRRRIAEFTNPSRSLDLHRNTLDDGVYFATEDRPTHHWFGRQFDRVRRSQADNFTQYSYQGYQGFMGELDWNRWKFTALGADHLLGNQNVWAGRAQWTGNFFRGGVTFVQQEFARGVRAARRSDPAANPYNDDNLIVRSTPFTDTTGGRYRSPGTDDSYEFDSMYFFSPNGHNREQWWGADIRVGTQKLYGYAELMGRRKDWAFIAYDNGDGRRPDQGANYFDMTHLNEGAFIHGGRERELSALFGAVWFPMPRLGLEVGYRMDDGTRLTLDRFAALQEYRPTFNTWHFRLRYGSEKFRYALEALNRTTGHFPTAAFPAQVDLYNFTNAVIYGVTDQTHFKHNFGLRLGKWTFEGDHRFRRYNIYQSTLESNELRGVIGYDLTRRVNLALSGRVKSYSLPNDPELTTQPNRPRRFYSSGLRATYAISQYVNLDFGIGVNHRNDEDIEEGQLFFLRDGLARARRGPPSYGGSAITRTLDQVMEAERILSVERRLEFNINARF